MNVLCENGWLEMLNAFREVAVRIRLFVNDHEPDYLDSVGAYVQASWSGYPGFKSLVWGNPFINESAEGQVNAAQLLWQHDGGGIGELVYGIYVTDAADVLLWAERFDAPVSMTTAADTIAYQPRLTVINQ